MKASDPPSTPPSDQAAALQQISELEKELAREIEDIQAEWAEIADDMEVIAVRPYKKDILVDLFGVAWFPYHLIDVDGRPLELPGYGTD